MGIKLRMTGRQHANIRKHVIAPDGNEAGSLLFCEPVFRSGNIVLLVKRVEHIPYEACNRRAPYELSWPTKELLIPEYDYLEREGQSLIFLHSHPLGYTDFSAKDDENDRKFLPRLLCCVDGAQPHGSAIMLPDGTIRARILTEEDQFLLMDSVAVAGDDIFLYGNFSQDCAVPDFVKKTENVYGSKTTNILRHLKVGVVGISGTGSPMTELLLRNHVGELVLIEYDIIEHGNLNRMLASRLKDADLNRLKVERAAEWIAETGLPTRVTAINGLVPSEITIEALASCDIIFGCVDNVAARHAINKISCAYLIPYFDLGVAIKSDEKGLRQALARCHYIQPDCSCLLDREAFSSERLRDENYRRDDPHFYEQLKERGYTADSNDVQAVMDLTMEASILAIDDFKARLHGYRVEPNREFDEQERSFTHGYYEHRSHDFENKALRLFVAAGDKHVSL